MNFSPELDELDLGTCTCTHAHPGTLALCISACTFSRMVQLGVWVVMIDNMVVILRAD